MAMLELIVTQHKDAYQRALVRIQRNEYAAALDTLSQLYAQMKDDQLASTEWGVPRHNETWEFISSSKALVRETLISVQCLISIAVDLAHTEPGSARAVYYREAFLNAEARLHSEVSHTVKEAA